MSRRGQAKALSRWKTETRSWAMATARELALDLYYNRETGVRPYGVGVALDAGERVLAEVPVRFNLDWPSPGATIQPNEKPDRPWLVTSDRLVGRLSDERLRGYRWERTVGARVDLTAGQENVRLDVEGEPAPLWFGPGVAPIAVAAVFHIFGPMGVVEHPGLAPLRDASSSGFARA